MSNLDNLADRTLRGERLNLADLDVLFATEDFVSLGYLAHQVNAIRNHRQVTFSDHKYISAHIEPGFVSGKSQNSAYVQSIVLQASAAISPITTEIRLISISPKYVPIELLGNVIQGLVENFPHCRIRALSAHQILTYSQLTRISPKDLLEFFAGVGLHSLEGRALKSIGNFKHHQNQNDKISDHDIENQWLHIHALAHKAGIKSDATLKYHNHLYDNDLKFQLQSIRDLQDQTAGFLSLIPINPNLAAVYDGLHPLAALGDLRAIAIARIYLDNVKNIRSPWGRLGMSLAQLALCFGANDFEGSLSSENNSRLTDAKPFRSMNRNEVRSLIMKAKMIPCERDADFVATPNNKSQTANTESSVMTPSDCSPLLYKASNGNELTMEQAEVVCKNADLLALASCAQDLKKNFIVSKRVAILASRIYINCQEISAQVSNNLRLIPGEEINTKTAFHIELGGQKALPTFDVLKKFILEVQSKHPNLELTLLGLKGLWQLAQSEGISLIRLADRLKRLNLISIESSDLESEDDLTPSEIQSTHTIFHTMDIATVGKLELAVPFHGVGEPLWQNFLNRIELFKQVQNKTHGILGIKIEAAQNTNVSPVEYLRAVAISRILLNNIPNIITSISQFPIYGLKPSESNSSYLRVAKRTAPLAALFGSSDLHHFPGSIKEQNNFIGELEKSGIQVFRRSSRFHPL